MEKLTEVLAMGGYGAYIWPSFVITALIMASLAVSSLNQFRRVSRNLAQLQDSGNET